MLEIRNLRKSYGRNLAVDEVSFFVPDGQIGILLGPNGAGKSTIIKSIAGLLRYQGQIGIQEIPARQLEAKRIFGYVPEIPAMFEALTVREHIEYIRKHMPVRSQTRKWKRFWNVLNLKTSRTSSEMNFPKE